MITIKLITTLLSIYAVAAMPDLAASRQGGDLHGNRRVRDAIKPQEVLAYQNKGELVFRIYLERASAKLGEELYLDMELINVSDRPQEVLPLDLKLMKTSLEITGPGGDKIEYIGPRPRVWIPWLVEDMVSLEPREGLQLRVNLMEFFDFKKAGVYRVKGDYTWEEWNLEGTGFALGWRKHILSNSMSFTLSGVSLNRWAIGTIIIALVIILAGSAVIIGVRRKHSAMSRGLQHPAPQPPTTTTENS